MTAPPTRRRSLYTRLTIGQTWERRGARGEWWTVRQVHRADHQVLLVRGEQHVTVGFDALRREWRQVGGAA